MADGAVTAFDDDCRPRGIEQGHVGDRTGLAGGLLAGDDGGAKPSSNGGRVA